MELRFLADVDQGRVTQEIRSAMDDVEVPEELLAAVIVADNLAAVIAEVQGFPDEFLDQVQAGGKTVPKLVDGRVLSTVVLPAAGFRLLIDELGRVGGDISRLSPKSK